MAMTVPDDVVPIITPAIRNRIAQLLEEAFKLASLADCSDVLEGSIDKLTAKYFQEGGSPRDLDDMPDNSDPPSMSILTTDLPSPRSLLESGGQSRAVGRNVKKTRGIPVSELVEADNYTARGNPVSRYKGVSYSGMVRRPWVARYKGRRLGCYKDEVSAAQAYERARSRKRG